MHTHTNSMPPHVVATIEELTAKRDQAQGVINSLTALYKDLSPEPPRSRPNHSPRASKPAVRSKAAKSVARAQPNTAGEPVAEKPISNRDLVRIVIAEGKKRNAVEVCDRVLEIRPGLDRSDVSTAISQLVRDGEARKTDGDLSVIATAKLKVPAQLNGAHA